jgi:hypothetical protein
MEDVRVDEELARVLAMNTSEQIRAELDRRIGLARQGMSSGLGDGGLTRVGEALMLRARRLLPLEELRRYQTDVAVLLNHGIRGLGALEPGLRAVIFEVEHEASRREDELREGQVASNGPEQPPPSMEDARSLLLRRRAAAALAFEENPENEAARMELEAVEGLVTELDLQTDRLKAADDARQTRASAEEEERQRQDREARLGELEKLAHEQSKTSAAIDRTMARLLDLLATHASRGDEMSRLASVLGRHGSVYESRRTLTVWVNGRLADVFGPSFHLAGPDLRRPLAEIWQQARAMYDRVEGSES